MYNTSVNECPWYDMYNTTVNDCTWYDDKTCIMLQFITIRGIMTCIIL